MILLVTPNTRAEECAAALHEETGKQVEVAATLRQGTTLLRSNEYLCVVLDQYLLETEADEASTLMEHLGTAIPVQVNLAISTVERLVREVRAAVRRRKREELIARRAAQETLHSELNGTVTALLLQFELAMASPEVSSAVAEKLHDTRELITKLRVQLQTEADRN